MGLQVGTTTRGGLVISTPSVGSGVAYDLLANHPKAGKGNAADDTAALQAAYAAAAGRPIHVKAGDYYLNAAVVMSGTAALRLVGEGMGRTIFHKPASTAFAQVLGGRFGPVNLGADVAAGAQALTVADGSSFAAGQNILVRSSAAWPGTNKSAKMGEIARVASVAGTTLNLKGPLDDGYLTADSAIVEHLTLLHGAHFEGFTIVNDNPGTATTTVGSGAEAFHLRYCSEPVFRNIEFKQLDGPAILMYATVGFQVDGCKFTDLTDDETNNRFGYGVIAYEASRDGRVSNCLMRGGRHLFTCGADSTGFGPPRHIQVVNCEATEMTNGGIDCHPEGSHITIANCRVHNTRGWGISVRAPHSQVIGCTDGVFSGPGIWVYGQAVHDVVIQGCVVRNCRTGPNPGTGVTRDGNGIRIDDNADDSVIAMCVVEKTDAEGIFVNSIGVDRLRILSTRINSPGQAGAKSTCINFGGSAGATGSGHRVMLCLLENATTGIAAGTNVGDVKAALNEYRTITTPSSGAGSFTDVAKVDVNGLGFFGVAPVARQSVTGSRGGNAALASLLVALSNLGLITNSSTA